MKELPRRASSSSTLCIAILGVVMVGLYAFEQRVIDAAANAQHGVSGTITADFIRSLPYPVVFPQFSHQRTYLLLVAIGLAQAATLFLLCRVIRSQRITLRGWTILAVCGIAMLLISLHARSLLSSDVYAYVGYAKIGGIASAYTPPAKRFPADLSAVNRIWGLPMVPSYYGPLWVVLSEMVAGGLRSLGAAIFAFRLLEIVPFVAIAAVLATRKCAQVLLPLFILNPAINNLYIANAHNDLVPLACLVVALAVVTRLPILSALLVVLASLIKIPFAAFALVAFAATPRLKQRLEWVAVILIVAAVAALLFGGLAYIHDLFARASVGAAPLQAGGTRELERRIVERSLLGVSLLALAAAFVRGWIVRSAAFTFIGMSPVDIQSWYSGWGLPYAALEDGALMTFLVLLPLVSPLLEAAFRAVHYRMMVIVLLAVGVELVARGARLQR